MTPLSFGFQHSYRILLNYTSTYRCGGKRTSVRGAGVPAPPSTVTPVASGARPKRDSRGWGSSSDDDEHYSSRSRNSLRWDDSSGGVSLTRIPSSKRVKIIIIINRSHFGSCRCWTSAPRLEPKWSSHLGQVVPKWPRRASFAVGLPYLDGSLVEYSELWQQS